MGSRVGLHEYHYRLSMANGSHNNNLEGGHKAFLFEMRTNFILKTRPPALQGVTAADVYIDSDTFRGLTHAHGDDVKRHVAMLCQTMSYRLQQYGMSRDQIISFASSAVAFARRMAARPEHANLNLIPVVVELEVCTVQQERETFDEAMGRAMRADMLVPPARMQKPSCSSSSFVGGDHRN